MMQDPYTPLRSADIDLTGEVVTVSISDRDTLSSQVKSAFSLSVKRPVCFVFHSNFAGIDKQWWWNGFMHNPLGGPARIRSLPQESSEWYTYPDGTDGNDNGPAYVRNLFGSRYEEKWISNGYTHRVDGPAMTDIDYNSGGKTTWGHYHESYSKLPSDYFGDATVVQPIITSKKQWFRRDICYNPDGWALQEDRGGVSNMTLLPNLGTMITEAFEERELRFLDSNGVLHRTDGPARIIFDAVKTIEKNGTQAPWKYRNWRGEWFCHGQSITMLEIMHWAQKNGITMWLDQPCYNTSAFADADGEFCFITDVLGERA